MNEQDQPIQRESFQVDLRGLVDVLSHHLYSAPTVFVRELLQNAVDAIEARQDVARNYVGHVRFEVDPPTRTIIVSDDGIGLSRQQILDFVSCVGASSKRPSSPEDLGRFIGQFGIGILSCFMVTDELLILTRSIEPKSPPLEWRARADGSYTLRTIPTELAVGSRVILQLREDAAEYAEFPRLAGLLRRYGEFLEQEVTVEHTGVKHSLERTSRRPELWLMRDEDLSDDDDEPISMELGFRPLGVIPIHDEALGLQAAAFILPQVAGPSPYGAHRLYLKRMFVTDTDVKVTPRWASFVRCVINSTRLQPTASRESVCEDDVFEATRDFIGARLGRYLSDLGRTDRKTLSRILSIHDQAMRQFACEDEAFFRLVIDLLPFETSVGPVRFGDFRAENTVVRLAPTVDQFRACAALASSQGITVFNGGYTHHTELLEQAVSLDPGMSLEIVDPRTLMEGLSPIDRAGAPELARLLDIAKDALADFGCVPMLKAFDPPDIPAVFGEGPEQSLARTLDAAGGRAEGFWKDIMEQLSGVIADEDRGAFLCLNGRCDLLRQLGKIKDRDLLGSAVRVIYVQALLLGRQPLTTEETQAFAASLGAILALAARRVKP